MQAAQSVGETTGTPGDLSALMETLKGQDAPPPTFVKVPLATDPQPCCVHHQCCNALH